MPNLIWLCFPESVAFLNAHYLGDKAENDDNNNNFDITSKATAMRLAPSSLAITERRDLNQIDVNNFTSET